MDANTSRSASSLESALISGFVTSIIAVLGLFAGIIVESTVFIFVIITAVALIFTFFKNVRVE